MASEYLVQAVFSHDSGLPEDVSVNTWSIRTAATGDLTALGAAITAIETFYEAIDTQLSVLLSGVLTFKAYDRSDPIPRVPVLTVPHLVDTGTTALPGEVAICLSFQAAPSSGADQSRRRGRVFLGPLDRAALNETTSRPLAATITTIVTAADALLSASQSAAGWDWVVWSEVNGFSTVVTNGWVDNDFDTQRRRGLRASSRTTFS